MTFSVSSRRKIFRLVHKLSRAASRNMGIVPAEQTIRAELKTELRTLVHDVDLYPELDQLLDDFIEVGLQWSEFAQCSSLEQEVERRHSRTLHSSRLETIQDFEDCTASGGFSE